MKSLKNGLHRQLDLIWSRNWKYLVVLDACRYDYFERIYKEFPMLKQGRLMKVISPGPTTTEWLIQTFRNRECKDIVYISANPYINSKGIAYGGFNPRKHLHFFKIIDVWDWGWDESLGTVHPKEVNKAAIIASRLYKDKRFIIHYLQPHYPYLTLITKGIGPKLRKEEMWFEKFKERRSLWDRVKGFIRWRLVELLGPELGRKIAVKLVGYPSPPGPSCAELVAKEIGLDELRRAYEENL